MYDQIFIIAATIFSFCCALSKQRKTVLMMAAGAGTMFLLYWLTKGEMTAVYMGVAALFGTALQYTTPEKHLAKTLYWRIALCFIIATIGFKISYVGIADLLPLAAFSMGRLSETFSKSINIQIGFIASGSLWTIFAITIGDSAAIISNSLLLVVQILCISHKLGLLNFGRFFSLQNVAHQRL